MFTNRSFELNPVQLQSLNDWAGVQIQGELLEECEGYCLEVVFEFSNIGRGVLFRVPGSNDQVILEDVFA